MALWRRLLRLFEGNARRPASLRDGLSSQTRVAFGEPFGGHHGQPHHIEAGCRCMRESQKPREKKLLERVRADERAKAEEMLAKLGG